MKRLLNRGLAGPYAAFIFVLAIAALVPAPLRAQESWWDWRWVSDAQQPYSMALSGGFGTEQYISKIFTAPWKTRDSGDRVVYLSGAREIGGLGHGALGFAIEAAYGRHFGRDNVNEYALSFVSRWNDFPWNGVIATTFSFGLGPSYTDTILPIERDKGITTKVLNQADLEFAFALPERPRNQVFFRIEHRSGVFGLIDGAGDGSNYLTLGYRRHF